MLVLTVNCGSSSVKFAVFRFEPRQPDAPVEVARGGIDLVASPPQLRAGGVGLPAAMRAVEVRDAASGVRAALDWLLEEGVILTIGPDAVAHRVVHGGARFVEAVRVDAEVRAGIELAAALAPLHNRAALDGIDSVSARFPSVQQIASFDTAFHRSMPLRASRYAVPPELAERHTLERFGFHGLAHRSMARRAAELLGRPPEQLRLVTLQLGAGCSAAAIEGGRSVDTSMGLTPLEGLMMATRSGDVDPTFLVAASHALGVTLEESESLLNHESGLLGVSGHSADVRAILGASVRGDERSALAVEMFCYRLRKQIGAYLAALGGADAIVFGGGIGEHQPEVRRRALEGLQWAGVAVDAVANEAARGDDASIAAGSSSVAALVVAVDEERELALDARTVMASAG
jgi:acetate kinase